MGMWRDLSRKSQKVACLIYPWRKELLAELTMASKDTGALTLKDKCRTREQRGQMITDNREDRRVIGPGGRLKASGRDTGYTDTENGPPSVGGTMIHGRVSQ